MRNHRLGNPGGKTPEIDRSIALLTACGSAICGAAAVLGVDGAIRPKPYKTAVAVATVVIFGTLSMFLYPILYRAGIFDLSPDIMGLFTGSTVHEVAHVVGAANAMGAEVSNNAIIVKMIRVIMLVPVLLVIAWTVARDVAKRDCLEILIPTSLNQHSMVCHSLSGSDWIQFSWVASRKHSGLD